MTSLKKILTCQFKRVTNFHSHHVQPMQLYSFLYFSNCERAIETRTSFKTPWLASLLVHLVEARKFTTLRVSMQEFEIHFYFHSNTHLDTTSFVHTMRLESKWQRKRKYNSKFFIQSEIFLCVVFLDFRNKEKLYDLFL